MIEQDKFFDVRSEKSMTDMVRAARRGQSQPLATSIGVARVKAGLSKSKKRAGRIYSAEELSEQGDHNLLQAGYRAAQTYSV